MGSSSRFARFVLVLSCLAVLAGCAGGKQNLLQNGQTVITWPDAPVEFLRDTPQPAPRECPVAALIKVRYLKEQTWPWYRADKWFSNDKPDQFFETCPDTHLVPKDQINLVTWSPIEIKWSQSVMRTLGPAAVQSAGLVAGLGTLGAVMPGTKIVQSQQVNGSPVNTSTLLINAPVPPGVAR